MGLATTFIFGVDLASTRACNTKRIAVQGAYSVLIAADWSEFQLFQPVQTTIYELAPAISKCPFSEIVEHT